MATGTVNIRQGTDTKFKFSWFNANTTAVSLDISEGISKEYSIDLMLFSEDLITYEKALGQSGKVNILCEYKYNNTSASFTRYFHGKVAEFTQLRLIEGYDKVLKFYKVKLSSDFEFLKYTKNYRIFQKMTTDKIIGKILKERHIEHEFVCTKKCMEREYCVQYNESEYEFIKRLLVEEGIFYYYDHSKENSKIIFADNTANYKKIEGKYEIKYYPAGMNIIEEENEYISEFSMNQKITVGKIDLDDYNFMKPKEKLKTDTENDEWGKYGVYDFGTYMIMDNESHRKDLAKVTLEKYQTEKYTIDGKSVCHRFLPGKSFKLIQHDLKGFNQEYVITEVFHTCKETYYEMMANSDSKGYSNSFKCLPKDVIFRPSEQEYHKPLVHGIQTATVTGKKNEEIYTDEYGRVKVKFHWDRSDTKNEETSCWIRVGQISAGKNMGALFLPRVDTEVIVDFINGDPDKPIIIGQLYNGKNKPVYTLDDHKTQSGIKTKSTTKGEGGYNELRFEDLKNKEELYIHAEKDFIQVIEDNMRTTIKGSKKKDGGNQELTIEKGNQIIKVESEKGSVVKKIEDGNMTTTVDKGDVLHDFGAKFDHNVKGDYTLEIKGNLSIKAKSIKLEASGKIDIKGSKIDLNK